MNPETRNCQSCKVEFIVEPEDFSFYERIQVPAPKLCPSCRQQRRYAWRNERVLYRRNCDLCKKSIVTIYSPNKDRITDDILNQTVQCKTQDSEAEKKKNPMCAKAFRLIPLELTLYRKLGIPIPDRCFACRRTIRFMLRNPRQLWKRGCQCNSPSHFHAASPCPNEFETSYAPERLEIVYCEQCYATEVA